MMRTERPSLDDTGISQDAPYVRALAAQRLEQIWQACLPHINGDVPNPSAPMVELGLRVIRELSKLYRLDAPTGSPPEAAAGLNTSVRELVASALDTLEQRMQSGQGG